MANRMLTGIRGLDVILDGGLLYHNSVLLKGQPGSGKTTLGFQIIYNGACRFSEPGVLVLFEQFPQQLYRDLASHHWSVEQLVEEKKLTVIFAQPDEITSKDQVADSLLVSKIHDAVIETGARRILVDGAIQFLNLVPSDQDKRLILLKFINALKTIGLTPILTAELHSEEGPTEFDEFLCDSVITLSTQASRDKSFPMRLLRIKKTRGQAHVRGGHPFRIGENGIDVFPHLPPVPFAPDPEKEPMPLEKVASGIDGLDAMLGGGYTRGTATIVAGMPGTFKTTLGVQFLRQGARSGETGLLIGFNENPAFLAEVMKQKGLDLSPALADRSLRLRHFFPKTFYVDELLDQLEGELKAGAIRRVVFDGINDLERSIENPETYKDYLTALVSQLARHRVTSIFIQKLGAFTTNNPLTNIRYASMFDGIVYLGTLEIESAIHKVVSVLKMRGGDYASDVREIACGDHGLYVLDKFFGISGILAGNPQGQYKKTVEEILQPLYFIRDFMDTLASSEIDEEQRRQLVGNMTCEIEKLIERFREYYHIDEGA